MSVVELRSKPVAPPIPDQETAAFKTAMRHLAGAVAVITTGSGEERTGFTATSVSSFSMEPPTLIVCLNRASSSWPIVQNHGGFCVNLLAHEQSHVADRFAGRGGIKGTGRYEGATWQQQPSGSLGLDGALVSIDCTLDEAIERHSHAILLGRVNAVTARGDAEPLLYWHGAYRLLSNLDRVLTQA
ncbi:4-hydroxyphenylacetate 3-monooxygenase, reductase component [Devosia sp. DBB001]|nr:4-hydroxyphenylacetate 3-monooxygenase, reductase component [Devosia sp. DBB001]